MSSQYRSPECMPDGAGPGVGSEQSGALIAEELYKRGQRTFPAASNEGRTPHRHRGGVIVEWPALATFFRITPEKLPVPRVQFVAPHVSLRDEGRTLYLHEFARDCKAAMFFAVDADRNVCIVDWESGRIAMRPPSGASRWAAGCIGSSGSQ